MTRTHRVTIVTLVLLSVAAAVWASGQVTKPSDLIPRRFSRPGTKFDMWVSESEILAGGPFPTARSANVRFADWLFRALEARAARGPEVAKAGEEAPCELGIVVSAGAPTDLSTLVRDSLAIVHGTVAASAPGVFAGKPGLLLAISADGWDKTTESYSASSLAYVFYPASDITIAGIRTCQPSLGWPQAPQVGDRIIALPMKPALGTVRGHPFLDLGGHGLIFESRGQLRTNNEYLSGVTAELTDANAVRRMMRILLRRQQR